MEYAKTCIEEFELSCDYLSFSASAGGAGASHVNGQLAKPKHGGEQKSRSTCSQLPNSSFGSVPHKLYETFDSKCRSNVQESKTIPNISYEVDIAKSILQQYSTLSGNNLYNHLSEIIKRVLDERPPNVIDFFEEYSRNVREQKFNPPDRLAPNKIFGQTRLLKIAKNQLKSMRLPYDLIEDQEITITIKERKSEQSIGKCSIEMPHRVLNLFSERIQQLQYYWNQCGFSISNEDIYLLSVSIERLQTHPIIQTCRFWGVINGLKASYYIVEAYLTKEQRRQRLEQMEFDLREKFLAQLEKERCEPELPSYVCPKLTPGMRGWKNYNQEDLKDMKPRADPIPLPRLEQTYDIPPEMIGTGLNRFSYFVVNSLSEDWCELPIVTPKQIVISRQIKKFFTGDMEAEICSYPYFPGKEKHYLRAMIARITCGTTIAPKGFYRKMTKYERYLDEGDNEEECEEEDENGAEESDAEEEEDEAIYYDSLSLCNEKYKPIALENLTNPSKWVHIRPYIPKQGRINWFDEMRARKELEKELELEESKEEDEDLGTEADDDEGVEEEEFEEEHRLPMFSSCGADVSDEFILPWVSRFTSNFTNKAERILVMRSNIWPGSFTFTFDKVCETIYMGWGLKHNSRNKPFVHLPKIADEYPHNIDDFVEMNDPSNGDETIYRAWLENKTKYTNTLEYAMSEFNIEGAKGDEPSYGDNKIESSAII